MPIAGKSGGQRRPSGQSKFEMMRKYAKVDGSRYGGSRSRDGSRSRGGMSLNDFRRKYGKTFGSRPGRGSSGGRGEGLTKRTPRRSFKESDFDGGGYRKETSAEGRRKARYPTGRRPIRPIGRPSAGGERVAPSRRKSQRRPNRPGYSRNAGGHRYKTDRSRPVRSQGERIKAWRKRKARQQAEARRRRANPRTARPTSRRTPQVRRNISRKAPAPRPSQKYPGAIF